jgi:hypothetical protein
MSDEQVRTFDIANRDQPTKTAELMLSTHVSQTLVHGDLVLRLSADWWTSEPRLELVPSSDPTRMQPLGAVDLGAMLAAAEQDQSCYSWSSWGSRMFADGNSVFLVWPAWNGSTARVAVVDVSDPSKPRVASSMDVPVDVYSYGGYYWGYWNQLMSTGEPVVQLGSQLAFLSVDVPRDEWGYPLYQPGWGSIHPASVRVLDLSNPDAPRVAGTVALPNGGGHTGLVAQDGRVLSSHWEPVDEMPGKVRFYLDRIDLGDPDAPELLEPINVPGSLVSLDSASSNLLTVDYQRETLENVTNPACYAAFNYGATFEPNDPQWWDHYDSYDQILGRCTLMHRKLRLTSLNETDASATLLGEHPLPDGAWMGRLLVADDRVFTTSDPYYTYTEGQSVT